MTPPADARLQLRLPILVLVGMLLLAVGVSGGAGLIGIRTLDRMLARLAAEDAQRLLTVTHIRRLFRSEIVTVHAIEEPGSAAERAELVVTLAKLREERAVQLDRLARLGVLDQQAALDALQRDHATIVQLGHDVSKEWEPAVSAILQATQRRLSRACADAATTSLAARNQLITVSLAAVVVALLLGAIVLRRVRHASESLIRNEAQFRAVVQSAPSLLAMLTPTGAHRYLPPRAPSFLGVSWSRLEADPLSWLEGDARRTLEAVIAEALTTGSTGLPAVRLVATRENGSNWQASASVTPLFDGCRQVTGVILQILDVSEQFAAERAQRELETQLRQAQKMETVGRLAGGIAHDFNNLLTAIKGYASLAQQEPNSNELPEYIDGIVAAADRAAHLTRQLLAFSRKHVIAPVATDLGALVHGLEKMLVRIIGEDVKLEVRVEDRLGTCLVDPHQVEQVVVNLAINARHAMPEGGSLLIEARNAELDEGYIAHRPAVNPGRYVLLSVSDTGVGMSKEVQEHIFEPFFTTKPVGQGTGLGLSVVYGTVQQHGGTIDVYSELGLGTAFRIYWPRVLAAADSTAPSSEGSSQPRGSETVLLVEDDDLVRNFVQKTLTQQGYRVVATSDAESALRALEGENAEPGLLLTDVVLPRMNGPDLAKQLRQRLPTLPILFMSGYSDRLMAERGQLPGDVDYLQKPFDAGTLTRRVRAAIDARRP